MLFCAAFTTEVSYLCRMQLLASGIMQSLAQQSLTCQFVLGPLTSAKCPLILSYLSAI